MKTPSGTTSNSCSELENIWIPLKDGRRLTARVWLPISAESAPVPAIVEYLPYRKRDATAPRDESTYPVFAAAGYAGLRVDISGTGESDGDFDDEYSERELADGVEIINWVAAQSWCTGRVGMMGISWGGFNSLQIAALRPEPLKAVIAIGTTMDRYNDDIHYKNGCLLYSNFGWSSVMLCYTTRPPDPALVGERWRALWRYRLQAQPFPLDTWLSHQRRDEYWKHGSICEDYHAITAAALVISGWADGYINAPPAAAANMSSTVKAINGPWIHQYPHLAWPHPRMDFHAEAIRWWDRWLKELDNGVDDLPAYRAFISENARPSPWCERQEGRWVAEAQWPSPEINNRTMYLGNHGRLTEEPGSGVLSVCSPQDCGTACGEFFASKPDGELPGDQRIDDAGSMLFESEQLTSALEILGRPVFHAQVAIDRDLGNLAVRLLDVHPDGASVRVSFGVINLAHRNGNEHPAALTPGEFVAVELALDECGYRFLPGHKIRLSVSTAYWPMVMPPPQVVTATLALGDNSLLELPLREGGDETQVREPTDTAPLPACTNHKPPHCERRVIRDLHQNMTHYEEIDDTGENEMPGHGLCIRHHREYRWSICPDDPLTAVASSTYTCWMSRGNWKIRTVSRSSMHCDAEKYYIKANVIAFEGENVFNERHWEKSITREFT